MTFKVIDKGTGREVSGDKLVKIAKSGGLMDMDIDQFAITEDGHIILLDDCGKYAYVSEEFEIVVSEDKENPLSSAIADLKEAFPESFINDKNEFIGIPETNAYFLLENCETVDDIKAKCLEWFSRDAYKTCPFNDDGKNARYHERMRKSINDFLGTDFDESDFELIYRYLGNSINHDLSMKFIGTGYDISVLGGK